MANKRIKEKYNTSKKMDYSIGNSAYHTTDRRRRLTNTYMPSAGSSDTDDLSSLTDLTLQCRDLDRNDSISRASVDTISLNSVGSGLTLKSTPNHKILGISKEKAEELGRNIDFRFNQLWGQDKNCDQQATKTFSQIQLLAMTSLLTSGDIFTIPNIENNKLRLNLIESDRVSTPLEKQEYSPLAKIKKGVEVNTKGEIVAYYVSKYHPYSIIAEPNKWTRVRAKKNELGLKNIIHTYRERRPGQRRGLPLLTPVIETLKKLSDLKDAELEASIITSMFAVFVTSEKEERLDGIEGGENGNPESLFPSYSQTSNAGLYSGTIAYLREGESIQTANPNRPNDLFEPFYHALLKSIGAGIGIPFEVLVKHFSSSYTAYRGALLEAWKTFKIYRKLLIDDFCNPVFEHFLALEIANENIEAPNFFEDEMKRRAYLQCDWMGVQQPQVDPLKETNASILKIQHGLSTHEKEAMETNGTDFKTNAQALKSENELLNEAISFNPLEDKENNQNENNQIT